MKLLLSIELLFCFLCCINSLFTESKNSQSILHTPNPLIFNEIKPDSHSFLGEEPKICPNGFGGDDCLNPICFNFLSNDTKNVCNGNGLCQAPDYCVCKSGKIGRKCEFNHELPSWKISAGESFSCLIHSVDTQIYCFGQNRKFQLSDTSANTRRVPTKVYNEGVMKGHRFTSIFSGFYHTFALSETGKMFTFGDNTFGELGDNSTVSTPRPSQFTSIEFSEKNKVIQACGGEAHSLILTSDSKLYSFGKNQHGQLGVGNAWNESLLPLLVDTKNIPIDEKIAYISCGANHNLIISDKGNLFSFGMNNKGQLGLGKNSSTFVPSPVTFNTTVGDLTPTRRIVMVAACLDHSLALESNGIVQSFGSNSFGQLGIGSFSISSSVPISLEASGALKDKNIVSISCGHYFSSAITSDGEIITWGFNLNGTLGDGTNQHRNTPVVVKNSETLFKGKNIQIASGTHSLIRVIDTDTTPIYYSFGKNDQAQLGIGSTLSSNVAVRVSCPEGYIGSSCNIIEPISCFGIAENDPKVCSGHGICQKKDKCVCNQGFIGISCQHDFKFRPSLISVGTGHSCFIHPAKQQVFCSGYNLQGELGIGPNREQQFKYNYPAKTEDSLFKGKKLNWIVSGHQHTLLAYSDGIVGWGRNVYGEVTTPQDPFVPALINTTGVIEGRTIVHGCGGNVHTVLLDDEGNLFSFGSNSQGQLGNSAYSQKSENAVSVVNKAFTGKIVSISCNVYSNIAIDSNGRGYSWGGNSRGQLGNGYVGGFVMEPTPLYDLGVLNQKKLVLASVGTIHSLVLDCNGGLYAFGAKDKGALGDGLFIEKYARISSLPVEVDTSGVLKGKTIIEISAGTSFNVVKDTDNQLYSWGDNSNSKLGDGTKRDYSYVPVKVSTNGSIPVGDVQIAVKDKHTMILASNNRVYGFGADDQGQLGDMDIKNKEKNVPTLAICPEGSSGENCQNNWNVCFNKGMLANDTVCNGRGTCIKPDVCKCTIEATGDQCETRLIVTRRVAAGAYHSCYISPSGSLYCFGDLTSFLDPAEQPISKIPKLINKGCANRKFSSIASGRYHLLAISDDYRTVCGMGANENGQLGIGNSLPQNVPVETSVGLFFNRTIQVCGGEGHSMALSANGEIISFGSNQFGQLGDGTFISKNYPVRVKIPSNSVIVSISCTNNHNLALDSDSLLYSWGLNQYGQLGDTTNENKNTPQLLSVYGRDLFIMKVVTIQACNFHSLVTTKQLGAYSFGLNSHEQLLHGKLASLSINDPKSLFQLARYFRLTGVGCGDFFSFLATSKGILFSNGMNTEGQIGTENPFPEFLENFVVDTQHVNDEFVEISGGGAHTIAITSKNRIFTWGDGSSGQLGDGKGLDRAIPGPISCPEGFIDGVNGTCIVPEQQIVPFVDMKLIFVTITGLGTFAFISPLVILAPLICCVICCLIICPIPLLFIPTAAISLSSRIQKKKIDKEKHDLLKKLLGGDSKNEREMHDIAGSADMTLFNLEFSDFKIAREITSGGSGAPCMEAQDKRNDEIVFIKLFVLKKNEETGDWDVSEFKNEISLFTKLRHPNIVTFYGLFFSPPSRVGYVCEFCKNGTLHSFLKSLKSPSQKEKKKFDLHKKMDYLIQIARGMRYLHQKDVIFRDLKPENILIGNGDQLKITDFGISKIRNDNSVQLTKNIGTSFYMAPEVVSGAFYNSSVDVFSFGIVMFEILFETVEPYAEKSNSYGIEFLVSQDPNMRPKIDLNFFLEKDMKLELIEPLIELMKRCWDHNPENRPNFKEIVNLLTNHQDVVDIAN